MPLFQMLKCNATPKITKNLFQQNKAEFGMGGRQTGPPSILGRSPTPIRRPPWKSSSGRRRFRWNWTPTPRIRSRTSMPGGSGPWRLKPDRCRLPTRRWWAAAVVVVCACPCYLSAVGISISGASGAWDRAALCRTDKSMRCNANAIPHLKLCTCQ